MAWYSAPLVLGAIDSARHYFNKPKQQQPDTGWMQRFINNWKGEVSSNTTQNRIMRDAQRTIGANATRANQQIGYDLARTGNEGLAASAILQTQKNSNAAGQNALQYASRQQEQDNTRYQNKIENLEMMRERIEAEARQRHNVAMDEWKQGWGDVAMNTAGRLATAGMNEMARNAAELKQQGTREESAGILNKLMDGSLNDADLQEAVRSGAMTVNEAWRYAQTMDSQGDDQAYFDAVKKLAGGTHEWNPEFDTGQNMKLLQLSIPDETNSGEAYYNELAGILKSDRAFDPKMTTQQNVNILRSSQTADTGEEQNKVYYGMSTNPDLTPEQVDAAVNAGAITPQMGLNLQKRFATEDIETDWYKGEDGLEHQQANINGQWVDTGITRKANYNASADKRQQKAQQDLVTFGNELEVYSKFTNNAAAEDMRDLVSNITTIPLDEAQDRLYNYVNGMDLPIKGGNSIEYPGPKGEKIKITLAGDSDEAKLFDARMKIYTRLTKALNNIRLNMGEQTTPDNFNDDFNQFDWD
jgi:cell division protein FtsB